MIRDEIILAQIEYWALSRVHDGFEIRAKEESRIMKFFAFFLGIFSDGFLSGYTTTIGSKVYFPRKHMEDKRIMWRVLAHEVYHIWSSTKKTPVVHGFLYLLPQALFPLALFSLLAIWFSNFWMLNLLWLLCLAPIPAYFRYREEMNAYIMTLCCVHWFYGNIHDKWIDHVAEKFTSSNYYWMWPFEKTIYKSLNETRESIVNGEYDNLYPYSRVREIIQESKKVLLLRPAG